MDRRWVCSACRKFCEVYQGRPTGPLLTLKVTLLSECCRTSVSVVSSEDKEP